MRKSKEKKIINCFNILEQLTQNAKVDLATIDQNFSSNWLTDKKFYIKRRRKLKYRYEILLKTCTVLFDMLYELKAYQIPDITTKKTGSKFRF